jgi:Chromo (CHRromatin Organisation MOdifier) domain
VPMKDKSAETTRRAFEVIFNSGRKPQKLMTDSGREFENREVYQFMKQNGVHHFFAWNPDIKAAIAERLIRTIKSRLWKILHYKKTKRYIDDLDDVVYAYNNNYHRSIKMTPTEASNPSNTKQVWDNLYSKRVRHIPRSRIKFKYSIGDYVRISEERAVFKKGYTQGWSSEVYRVVKQSPRDPVVYKLEDLSGEPVIGSFYETELQKVVKPESWEIEQILKTRRTDKRGLEYYVKFKGYPDYENRWVPATETVAA